MGKKRKSTGSQRQTRTKMNLQQEAAYIVGRAQDRDARLVSLGSLVFFSTETGDAWMLDADDGLALCLARDGSPQPVRIMETEKSAAVEWEWQFHIEGDLFTTVDRAGNVSTIAGYPTAAIGEAIRRTRP